MATNEERFRTPEERVKAFREFLRKRCGRGICEKECEVRDLCASLGYDGKFAGWLALEAEEEKTEPCPFCGGETHINLGHLKAGVVHYWVDCISPECMYRSAHYTDKDTAIATHNRFARAARMAKESEAGQ